MIEGLSLDYDEVLSPVLIFDDTIALVSLLSKANYFQTLNLYLGAIGHQADAST